MKLDDFVIAPASSPSPPVLPTVDSASVDASESRLWLQFPHGYREYITRFGQGTLAGKVRVFSPQRVEKDIATWRKRVSEHWFWEDEVLPRDRGVECVPLGETVDGDELVFHPSRPDHIFVMARHSNRIFDAGKTLLDALSFILEGGELCEPIPERDFLPFSDETGEATDSEATSAAAVVVPNGSHDAHSHSHSHSHSVAGGAEPRTTRDEGQFTKEALDDLLSLTRAWSTSRNLVKMAESSISEIPNRELEYEALMLTGNEERPPGYMVCFALKDEMGNTFGRFKWSTDGSSFVGGFE